jgi:glycosyltransferase involved in cell wall biosynthesis
VRVGVDGRSLGGGGPRGVAHYTSALLRALAVDFPDDEWRVLLPRGAGGPPPGVTAARSPWPARVLFGAAALAGRPRLERLLAGCDVIWAPAPAPLALGDGVPFVLTVHDRSWELRAGDFTRYERAWHALARPRRLAARADRVLCDAEVVRGDLIDAWGLEPGRVRAVPLAPYPRPTSHQVEQARAYFLFVGALEPRKAPDVLVEAYARARERGLEADLVLAGEGRIAVAGPGVRRMGRVDDGRLARLYAGALAVVLPSWVEGFGMTPLEGLTHGVPAVVSDLPVLRERLGDDGALYVPPGDREALADALLTVARDPALRARLLAAGRAATAELSWQRTARATRAILAEAAGR